MAGSVNVDNELVVEHWTSYEMRIELGTAVNISPASCHSCSRTSPAAGSGVGSFEKGDLCELA